MNVQKLKKEFPKGTKVRCLYMSYAFSPVPNGTDGVVTGVDDMGTIHVNWKTGSSLGLIYGEDIFVVLQEEENE